MPDFKILCKAILIKIQMKLKTNSPVSVITVLWSRNLLYLFKKKDVFKINEKTF